jgi:hypothetical protein
LRKLFAAALVAVMSLALAAVALAQNPDPSTTAPTVTGSISPAKAGTKSKPKPSTLKLFVKNNRTDATVSTITISLPKNLKLSGTGFPVCTAATLNSKGKAGCPAGSKAGTGTANAVVGPGRAPIKFSNDVYIGGKNTIVFYVQQVGGTVRKALNAPITRAGGKYGQKLTVKIDPDLQQPAPGVFSSLVDLKATVKAQRRGKSLVTTTGCPTDRKHRTGVKFAFAPNSTFPATGSVSGTAQAPCSK